MKKFFYVLLTILIIFTLVSCSEKSKSENDETNKAEKTKVENHKAEDTNIEDVKTETPKDKLCKFVLENGGYDEETDQYVYIKNASSVEDATAYFGIFYNQTNGEVLFSFYKSNDHEENLIDNFDTLLTSLEFGQAQNGSAMEVSLLGSSETYEISAFGEIYPEQVSMENLEIHNIDYYLNDDISLTDPELTSHIDSLLDLELKKLILYLYATLEEIPDITIQDLGFTNLVSVTK